MPVAVLIHRVVAAGVPNLALVRVAEREDEVVAGAVEIRPKDPLLRAEATKFVACLVLDDEQGRLVPLQLLYERVH